MTAMVVHYKEDLWSLVWGKPEVDPVALAKAIEGELERNSSPDFRTRLLIRDSTEALEQYWGKERLEKWLMGSRVRGKLQNIRQEKLGRRGFPFLREQIVERTDPETIKQFLRELGAQIPGPLRLQVGGSVALIMSGYLSRATTDIDVVDEVPAELRSQRVLLDELNKRYRLQLTHFQSHYLPTGWEGRLHYLGMFGQLQVYTVDVYDMFLCKLFSKRTKDLDDLRFMLPEVDKGTLVRQLHATTQALQKDPFLRQQAEKNWYVLFGEALPSPG
jgi:hypothetical protein